MAVDGSIGHCKASGNREKAMDKDQERQRVWKVLTRVSMEMASVRDRGKGSLGDSDSCRPHIQTMERYRAQRGTRKAANPTGGRLFRRYSGKTL